MTPTSRGRRAATWVALAGSVLLATTCGPSGRRAPRHVVLISIDSLRADRLGCYGNPRETSPVLDRLASEGARFANAYSPSSWTLPSHATLLTGLAQRHHGALTSRHRILPGTPGLASILRAHGYRTRGVYAGPFLAPLFGFAEGFDDYVSCETYRGDDLSVANLRSHGDETNPCVRRVVEQWANDLDDRPTFWFVHMWDVHYDYIPPAEYVRRFDPHYRGKLTGRQIARKGFPRRAKPRDVAHLLARYDGEIRYTDDTIGAMLAALRATGRLDDSLIVVTSDHGDEFLEHGRTGHMKTVFAESVRIPLVIRGPGVPRGVVVETPVALQDVAPTILDLLGIEALEMDGLSLRGLMQGVVRDHPPVVSVFYMPFQGKRPLSIVTMAIRGRDETVLRPPASRAWVAYDSPRDPFDQIPMPLRDAERAAHAAAMLRSMKPSKRVAREAGRVALPKPVRRRLKALGYLE